MNEVLTALPVLVIFPHSRCNCRCVMCDIWKVKDAVEITPGDVDKWLLELERLGTRQVVFSGGEPLMHSDLPALARPLRGAGIRVTLLSSGISLAAEADRIREIADEVIVSLDGPQPVHDGIRRVRGAFEKLATGVASLKAGLGAEFPVSARCTVQRENFTHLREAVDAAREIGLDRISFLAVDVSSAAFNRPEEGAARAAASPLALTEPEIDQLRAELDALFVEKEEEFRNGFIAESKEKLERNLYAYFAAVCGKGEFPFSPCNAPWVSAVIEADGTVRPCFFHEPLGNVKETGSLGAVLNSDAAIAFRRGLDVRTNPVCIRCVCRLNLKGEG